MFDRELDSRVRAATSHWLDQQIDIHGDVLPYSLLFEGFLFGAERVRLFGPKGTRGIWKPSILSEVPLSFRTKFDSPYRDAFGPDNLLKYKYQGSNIGDWDNVYMRNAMKFGVPLVYFYAVSRGRYLVLKPAFVVNDHPEGLYFSIAMDSGLLFRSGEISEPDDARRKYVTVLAKARLHQRTFRERVLDAYRRQCAFCRLRHTELLDAAHIVPDSEPEGEPHVNNGLALCKLHHSAFERLFLGLTPDYLIEVREDLRLEEDGPTLKHAIQGLHGTRICLPSKIEHQPKPSLVRARYELFRAQ